MGRASPLALLWRAGPAHIAPVAARGPREQGGRELGAPGGSLRPRGRPRPSPTPPPLAGGAEGQGLEGPGASPERPFSNFFVVTLCELLNVSSSSVKWVSEYPSHGEISIFTEHHSCVCAGWLALLIRCGKD